MLAFRDTTEEVREPKSARLEQRTKPRVKHIIERAAHTLGVDTSDFVISAAYKEAMSTLDAYTRTALDRESTRIFFAAIEGAAAPNARLVEAMREYELYVGNAIK